ncbi:exodeoxyribonuclease V subunit beta [Chromatiales bacterium (ex Bugula neritina AB1)]|nr:exodeoxyribonuclease V subunit beta [Chromatiales bacterium (ex Bugula neritina AB1)]
MTAILNAATLPLSGRHLIEASAGTGKTFTVANLYLRLLIDAQQVAPPAVEEILVVTFTNAATEELRARLRSRIAVALQVLDGESPDEADPTLHAVLGPHSGDPVTKARLELAYQCMDQAAIFTIHGFCDRVLREQAFESGELFDAELQASVDTLKLRAAEAWWRNTISPMPAAEVESIPSKWRTPAAVLSRLSSVITDTAGQVVPQFTDEDVRQSQAGCEVAWQAFHTAWTANGEGENWAEQILAAVQSKLINKGRAPNIYTAETVNEASQLAASLVESGTPPGHLDQRLSLLGNEVIRRGTRKGKGPIQSALGERIDALVASYGQWGLQKLVALQCNAKVSIGADLAQRKLLARQRTFDDLLLQLHAVLQGKNGERLTGVLRARFPVALIDEFQDTDRIQYEIFDKLFPQDPGSTAALYLIGDPKQSIYRFRGADINMYLRARDSADERHSLDKNYRSSSRLLNALNAVYGQSDQPFGNADISYQPVTAGGHAEKNALTVAGEVLPPLQFDCIEVSDDKLPVIVQSTAALARHCAQRIAWLLVEGNKLGRTQVAAKDIAVLVANHLQGQAIRDALHAVGVGSAMQSRHSVFQSPEALDILALLRVLARPGDSGSLSRVLVSPLAGYSASELLQQRDDAVAWQRVEDAVQRCREQCRQAGPQAAVLRFMSLFKSRVKAMGTAAAEGRGVDRVIGNYLHLADVLQTAWQEQPDLPALLKTAQHWREQGADEALQLRLESDEALVQIMTVHKSKGLQFPVVMLPFICIGKDATVKGDVVSFADNGQPRLDVGSDQLTARQAQATQALIDESLRALYVALTRAEQSCWIGVAANKNAKHAALWQLLGVSFPAKLSSTSDCQVPIMEAIDRLLSHSADIAKSGEAIMQGALQLAPQLNETPRARSATRQVHASWRVGSYTALARGATHAVEQPDHDAVDVAVPRPETVDYNSPFHFPRGADAGTLVHSVFEHLDFRNTENQFLHGYAEKQLRDHGVDTAWTPALCQLVRNTLNTPLDTTQFETQSPETDSSNFSLSMLDNKNRIDELGFHFPVHALDAEKLVALLRESGVIGAEDNLLFDRLDGYMTGFIDLTFRHNGRWYIADYKSNHLGYDTADYHGDALTEAMHHHRYDLQYLIYAVALQRYLKSRLPDFNYDSDFGGVYYLFVRGMPGAASPEGTSIKGSSADRSGAGKASAAGVYAARPPEDFLQALDELLSGGPDHA